MPSSRRHLDARGCASIAPHCTALRRHRSAISTCRSSNPFARPFRVRAALVPLLRCTVDPDGASTASPFRCTTPPSLHAAIAPPSLRDLDVPRPGSIRATIATSHCCSDAPWLRCHPDGASTAPPFRQCATPTSLHAAIAPPSLHAAIAPPPSLRDLDAPRPGSIRAAIPTSLLRCTVAALPSRRRFYCASASLRYAAIPARRNCTPIAPRSRRAATEIQSCGHLNPAPRSCVFHCSDCAAIFSCNSVAI